MEKGDLESVVAHLEKGGDANLTHSGAQKWSLLHFAARWGHLDLVNGLIKKGANLEAKTADGWTPLFFAALNGHLPVVKSLLAQGANANARDQDGQTALDYAEDEEVMRILAGAGGKKGEEL